VNGGQRIDVIEYQGQCHCGALTVRFQTGIAPSAWPIRACQCSFCRGHGALSTSDPNGKIAFTVTDARWLQRYRFGLETADFLICARCGVYVGARFDSDKGHYGIVNVRVMPSASWPVAQPMDYEGEALEARSSRREARWTPVMGDSL
jgi:hypothetical protein